MHQGSSKYLYAPTQSADHRLRSFASEETSTTDMCLLHKHACRQSACECNPVK